MEKNYNQEQTQQRMIQTVTKQELKEMIESLPDNRMLVITIEEAPENERDTMQ